MAIDTLAYAKHLEAAGVPRPEAEAQAEALTQHVLPDLATKDDLEHAIERLKHDLTIRFVGFMVGIMGLMNGTLHVLLRGIH
jgi:hypothetical protein